MIRANCFVDINTKCIFCTRYQIDYRFAIHSLFYVCECAVPVLIILFMEATLFIRSSCANDGKIIFKLSLLPCNIFIEFISVFSLEGATFFTVSRTLSMCVCVSVFSFSLKINERYIQCYSLSSPTSLCRMKSGFYLI